MSAKVPACKRHPEGEPAGLMAVSEPEEDGKSEKTVSCRRTVRHASFYLIMLIVRLVFGSTLL